MAKIDKIREQVLNHRADHNISFDDLLTLARSLGLNERSGGKHAHIFDGMSADKQPIFLNFQKGNGNEAKPYQVNQLRRNIIKHNL